MADSNITCSSLAVANGVGALVLAWAFSVAMVPGAPFPLPYLDLDHFEVWSATVNDRATATLIAQPKDTSYTLSGLGYSDTRYFWVRAVDKSSNVGDWFPVSSTGGVNGTTLAKFTGTDLQPNSVPGSVLQVASISAREMILKDFSNLVPDETWSTWPGNWGDGIGVNFASFVIGGSSGVAGGRYVQFPSGLSAPAGHNIAGMAISPVFPVSVGQEYAVGGGVIGANATWTGTAYISIYWYNGGSYLGQHNTVVATVATTYNTSAIVTAPANATQARLVLTRAAPAPSTVASGIAAWYNVFVRKAANASLIVDGSVKANHAEFGTVAVDLLTVGGKVITAHIGTQQVTSLFSSPHWSVDNSIPKQTSYRVIDSQSITITTFPVRLAAAININTDISGNTITVALLYNNGGTNVEIAVASHTMASSFETWRFDLSANHLPGPAGSYTYRLAIKNLFSSGNYTLGYWGWAEETSLR